MARLQIPKPPRPRAMSVSKKMWWRSRLVPLAVRYIAQNTLRQEKMQRVSNQLRKSKPDGASAPSWKYFECYVLGSLNKYAVCTLCIEQQELERAEIIYSQSPSNRLRHLNTDYPGHRAACDACVEKKNTKKTAARGASGGGSGGQKSGITSYFGVDTSGCGGAMDGGECHIPFR